MFKTVTTGVLCLLFCGWATANTIFKSANFSGTVATPSFAPFNHNLGTLNSVEVTIDGQISGQVQTLQNIDPFAGPIPVPFSVTATQDFDGQPGNSLFAFISPATFSFTGVGTGAGEVQTVTETFHYSFQFNATTDLSGLSSVSSSGPVAPPGLASGTRASFTDTFNPAMFEMVTSNPGSSGNVGGIPLVFSSSGGIIVEYDYTPARPEPVPEPASLALLGSGAAGLIGTIRRRIAG